MTETAEWLAECHHWRCPLSFYESIRALMLLAALAERYHLTDEHFERMAAAIRAGRTP